MGYSRISFNFYSDYQTNFQHTVVQHLQQIREFQDHQKKLLKIVAFVDIKDRSDFHYKIRSILSFSSLIFGNNHPAIEIVPQKPYKGIISWEIFMLNGYENVEYVKVDGHYCSIVKSTEYSEAWISGINSPDLNDPVMTRMEYCFEKGQNILNEIGFEYSDVIRQWNYLENIEGASQYRNKEYENYPLLNKVRSCFYYPFEFKKGYPATSDIDIKTGGFILGLTALKSETLDIKPLKVQTQNSLVGADGESLVEEQFQESEPNLVSGGKIIAGKDSGIAFLSATTTVNNALPAYPREVVKQTRISLESILSQINALKVEYPNANHQSYRVYLREYGDIEIVKRNMRENTW